MSKCLWYGKYRYNTISLADPKKMLPHLRSHSKIEFDTFLLSTVKQDFKLKRKKNMLITFAICWVIRPSNPIQRMKREEKMFWFCRCRIQIDENKRSKTKIQFWYYQCMQLFTIFLLTRTQCACHTYSFWTKTIPSFNSIIQKLLVIIYIKTNTKISISHVTVFGCAHFWRC